LPRKIAEAKTQTQSYRAGSLAGIELQEYRYLVMVSSKALPMPADDVEDGITFRHIGIAVDPDSPSVAAPRLVAQRRSAG
jgi:hypothetical protein